jgi:hypothetical protein
MLKIATLAAAALAATTLSAAAHESRKPIDRTLASQNHQIEDARLHGDLTRREYRALKAEQEQIAEMERRALADGHFSKREAREIKTAQKEAAQHIREESSDRQVSWYRRWLYLNR